MKTNCPLIQTPGMLWSLFLVIITLALTHCSEPLNNLGPQATTDPDVRIVDGRMAFENTDAFFDLVSTTSQWDLPQLTTWTKKYNFASLLESVDTSSVDSPSLKQLPYSYQAILNNAGEILIGDTIVWYSAAGTKHYIPNADEEALAAIKRGARESEITRTYQVTLMPIERPDNDTAGRFGFVGEIDARWQYEFCFLNRYITILGKDICTARRKYVHELYNFVDGSWHTLYVRIKLEWYGNSSHRWQAAGENRTISYNLSYTAQLFGGRDSASGAFYGTKTGYSTGNQMVEVLIARDLHVIGRSTYWDIDIRGWISQAIADDPYNGWGCVGYPLW